MTSQDIIEGYLNSLKRPIQVDPDERWINTYKTRAGVISKFFRWLACPDLKPEERIKMPLPPSLKGLRFFQKERGTKTNVKAQDLWTLEDDIIFLKYCEDPRIVCYHAMARDTSGRPGELLAVKIGDIKIQKAGTKIFAEVEIGRYGKKRKGRIVPLINSLPYVKAWLAQHPMSGRWNPNAYLFISNEHSAKYRNVPLKLALFVVFTLT